MAVYGTNYHSLCKEERELINSCVRWRRLGLCQCYSAARMQCWRCAGIWHST